MSVAAMQDHRADDSGRGSRESRGRRGPATLRAIRLGMQGTILVMGDGGAHLLRGHAG